MGECVGAWVRVRQWQGVIELLSVCAYRHAPCLVYELMHGEAHGNIAA